MRHVGAHEGPAGACAVGQRGGLLVQQQHRVGVGQVLPDAQVGTGRLPVRHNDLRPSGEAGASIVFRLRDTHAYPCRRGMHMRVA